MRLATRRLPFLALFIAGCAPPPGTLPPAPAGPETISLTVSEGTTLGFDLSPDGRTIVFDLLGQLWTLPAEGGAATPLTHAVRDTAEDLDPTWSRDGRTIAFQGERAGRRGAWEVDAAGGTPRFVAESVPPAPPALDPAGARIAFFGPDSAGRTQVWLRRAGDSATAGPATRLTGHADVTPTRVRWSPDGGSLLYSADGGLWRVPAAGGTPTRIPFSAHLEFTRARRPAAPPRFPAPGVRQPARGFTDVELSPDGGSIALLALGRLWVMPVGGTPREVTEVPLTARHLAWRPDGSEVAWSAGAWDREDLYATVVADGTTRRLTSLPGREALPAWSPDGRYLAFVHAPPTGSTRLRVAEASTLPVADSGAARALGTVVVPWLAPDAMAPEWSPASDGVLHLAGGFSPRTPSAGRFLPLAGGSRFLKGFPDSPIYLRWTAGALTWVRHDRLWRAPLDAAGQVGAATPLGDSPALYASAARDGSVLFASGDGLVLRAPDGAERHLGWPLDYMPPVPPPLLLRNVRVISGAGDGPTPPRDLLLERGRITRIAAAGTLRPGGAAVLDAAGRFAIPGLMDLHAHAYEPARLPGHLWFGITTIRDQGSAMASLVAWGEAFAAGRAQGPRVAVGGFQYYTDWAWDGDEGRGIEPESDPAHVRRSVALAAGFGAPHVKTRTFYHWDINARIVAEAHRLGMRATGHCAHPLPLVAAGMDAQEHTESCGPRADTGVYDDLLQLFRAAGIGVVPTISYQGFPARMSADPAQVESELGPFAPPREELGGMATLDPEQRRRAEQGAEVGRRTALRFHRAGVTVGVGTDIWQVPAAVHFELEELVAAGFTPLEAIGAGTLGSARILGAEAELGSIEPGKRADLVLLDADPTVDIRNTRRIWRVLKDGRVVDREALAAGAAK